MRVSLHRMLDLTEGKAPPTPPPRTASFMCLADATEGQDRYSTTTTTNRLVRRCSAGTHMAH